MKQDNKKGFTLIELLVVIAIIAILAAILFPIFIQARGKARQTTCLSNLKQLAFATNAYMTDSNGHYPSTYLEYGGYHYEWFIRIGYYNTYPHTNIVPKGHVTPYVKNLNMIACPHWIYKGATNPKWISYAANGYLWGTKDSMLPNPKDYILVCDRAPSNYGLAYCLLFSYEHPGYGAPDERHSGLVNVVFCDGHARSVKKSFFYGSKAAEDAHLRFPGQRGASH